MTASVQPMPTDAPKSLSNLFVASAKRDICAKCGERAYPVERIGPIKNEAVFHKACFKCAQCQQRLTLRTYFTNQADPNDREVYCGNHCPKTKSSGLDANAMGIRSAIAGQKTKAGAAYEQNKFRGQAPQFGSDAMHILHPLHAQNALKQRNMTYSRHHYWPGYLKNSKARQKLIEAQEELEKQHRSEEDRVMSVFLEQRGQENMKVDKEMNEEWEQQLKQLTDKYEGQFAKKGKKNGAGDGTLQPYTEHLEMEKAELRKTMTIKFQKKKEAATMRLQKQVQEETARLVAKQSEEMMELLKVKQEEVKEELALEIKKNQLENKQQQQLNNSNTGGFGVDGGRGSGGSGGVGPSQEDYADNVALDEITLEEAMEKAMEALSLPKELTKPHPPDCRKRDLYYDAEVFRELDDEVINIAEKEQKSFTDLVLQLTQNCMSDLEKARAIFRWITVKDLNVLEFDETVDKDTPMGLMRGIKYGTETYHTLFMRLCSYAGLACVEIKGHSKSVGYEPGMKIRQDIFQNTWNAVLIAGDWWPVQCNWGARHLVLNKDQDKSVQVNKQDKIRYQYDEHYFLTDPDEFIQEFWAQEPQWQLLERPIMLDEFESMPFVRSVFFHYGLEFDNAPLKAVLFTDDKGGAEVRIRVPAEFERDLVFHYQIRFADRERRHETEYQGAKLERFIFHSLNDGLALFSAHVPIPAAYFLEIFASKIDDNNKLGDDPNATMLPFRLKCACKFKIICDQLAGKMHPLPNCASGEWGPIKAARHFGLTPITHRGGVITVDSSEEIRFKLPRALHFVCKLKLNGLEDRQLEKFVSHVIQNDMLKVTVTPPHPGQFGLDIYARAGDAADSHTLAHACKYLLNVTRVSHAQEIPSSPTSSSSGGGMSDPSSKSDQGTRSSAARSASSSSDAQKGSLFGPLPQFDELGIKVISHRDPIIDISDEKGLVQIDLGFVEALKFSYQLKRDAAEDCSDRVTLKDGDKKARFVLNLAAPGTYTLAIFAKRKKDSSSAGMTNVYNYCVKFSPAEDADSKSRKKKGGLFKK